MSMHKLTRSLWRLLSTTLILLCTLPFAHAEPQSAGLSEQQLRQLMQMAEYIGVDYSEAVHNGAIVNDAEYAEMQEFATTIAEQSAQLSHSADADAIRSEAKALKSAIAEMADLPRIKSHTEKLRRALLAIAPSLSLPVRLLPNSESAALYQDHCAVCHGTEGRGDGQLSANMDPPPIDFHDRERAENRSLLGLYDAISNGLDGTAMVAFKQLSDQQRWSLAFYVGGIAFDTSDSQESGDLQLQDLVMYSPQVLQQNNPELSADTIAALRADAAPLFAEARARSDSPIETAKSQLQKSLEAFRQGDYDSARTLAISAYLDGFELAESTLDSHDASLRRGIEQNLLALRAQLTANSDPANVEQQVRHILTQLDNAQALLDDKGLSSVSLFIASLIILLREGLEALLVIIALVTILIASGRRDALKYVHIGWISAFIAGVATWLAARSLINISGASREVMEGVAAALAAAVLFYVGYWMHSKTHADEWQKYIRKSIDRSLTAGTLWGIAGLAFIAVYREIFETILFYQALLTQTSSGQFSALWGGIGIATILLAALGWAMVRYSKRLPIGKFFNITTYALLALSFVLAGKAVAALQEAALIGISPLPLQFSFDWLGIYSTWQGIVVQLVILVTAVWLTLKGRKHHSTTA